MRHQEIIQDGDYNIEILSNDAALKLWEKCLMKRIRKTVHGQLNEFLRLYLRYGRHKDEPICFRATLELGHISDVKDIEENETPD